MEMGAGRVSDGTAVAVGLKPADAIDHESGGTEEPSRIEPSISGTQSDCAHRLHRSVHRGTEVQRGADIEANENRSTSR